MYYVLCTSFSDSHKVVFPISSTTEIWISKTYNEHLRICFHMCTNYVFVCLRTWTPSQTPPRQSSHRTFSRAHQRDLPLVCMGETS